MKMTQRFRIVHCKQFILTEHNAKKNIHCIGLEAPIKNYSFTFTKLTFEI